MKKVVKVLQIGMTSNMGGLETYLMQQFRHLDTTRVHYDFVNITAERPIVFQEEIEAAGSQVYGVTARHRNPIKHYWQWCVLLWRSAKQYDAIVLNSNGLTYIFPLFAAKLFGISMRVLHSHNAGFEKKVGLARSLLIAVNRCLMKYSVTDYFACSEAAGRWMFGEGQTYRCIHNAIDPEPFIFDSIRRDKVRAELRLEDRFVVGHVGRFAYQKYHKKVIDIFREIHRRNPAAVLLLVGDAGNEGEKFLADAHRQVQEYGLEEAVRFLGMRQDVPDLMQAMDIFLLPSRFEGLCLVGVEAQTAGLPCFFSDTITREIAITDLTHFISLDASPVQWAAEILKTSAAERKDMSREIEKAGYDIHTEIQKVERLYEGFSKRYGGLLRI